MTAISVILPLYNAEHHLPVVLPPLRRALDSGAIREVIVIDDSSTDDGPGLCRAQGFQVLPSGGRLGPGGCRNQGVREVAGDVVLFIDSDCVMNDDVPSRVARVFEEEQDCVAMFGSYDDEPAAPGLVSRYRNLLHHYTHQMGRREASTFWAGCGAVRRDVYLEVGGFNEEKYGVPSIEDIELGNRLKGRGRILLIKDVQCKHLKLWTLGSMIHTDIFKRALPWSRLLLRSGFDTDDLNVSRGERLKAALAGLFWLAWLGSPLFFPYGLLGALGMTLLAFLVNRPFFGLVYRKNGLLHLVASVFLQQLYYLYSAATLAYCMVEKALGR